MKSNKIDVRVTESDGIIILEYKEGVSTLDMVVRGIEKSEELIAQGHSEMMVVLRGNSSLSKDARKYLNVKIKEVKLTRLAYVIESFMVRIIVSGLFRIGRPPYPMAVFSSMKDADLWLKKSRLQD